MTSYCAPNYQFFTTAAHNISVSCMWLGKLKRQNKLHPLQAALLLHSNINNKQAAGDIWLMANNAKIATNEKVIFTLQVIDPTWLLAPSDTSYLHAFIGLTLQGELKEYGAAAL
ncbi:hypothetical protein GCM10009111_03370 [Colwellia asteriadis]|uniref:Uncharacterized protein n=1 Tax=Colwellia asteriadis TaxID=517723 RepID=A0ABP3WBX5_9GAMM